MRHIGIWLLLSSLSYSCASESPFPDVEEARFATSLEEMQESQEAVGGLTAVDDGQHRYLGAIGMADSASGRAMTVTTPYRTASMGKTFTDALILSLHDEGALSVEDPLSSYVPDFPNGENITLRML